MKRNFKFFLTSLVVLGIFASCDKPQPEEGKDDGKTEQTPGTGDDDGNGNEGGNEGGDDGGSQGGNQTGDLPKFDFPYMADYPLEPGILYAEGSDVGVTIEVTKVEDQNFVFELRPGAMVQSFKFDVYPLAQLYNNLLNDRNAGVLTGTDAIDMEEHIRTFLFNTSGSGGYEISINDFDNPEDFLQIEYDWMSTSYAAASAIAIPDCDYVIAVVGSTDTSISTANQEQITLCYVHTTSQPLIGDPQVEIEVNVGYTGFNVQHYPNSDAAGIYFFGGLAAEVDEYIDAFGDIMFRDFMRTRVTGPSVYNPDEEGSCFYSFSYGLDPDPSILSATCAVAVDANLTPATEYSRSDFHLKEAPAEMPEAFAEIDVLEEKVGSGYFEFDIKFSETCRTVLYRLYTKEQKEEFEAMTSSQRKKELSSMILDGSMGCHNPNFPVDAETGASGICRETMFGLEGMVPGTEVYVGFFCRNAAMQYSDMMFSDPAALDTRNLTSSEECKVKDFDVVARDPGRQTFTVDITYDPETVSLLYIQAILPEFAPATVPTADSPWADWVDFIMNWQSDHYTSEEFCANIMCWPNVSSGKDGWTFTGLVPGKEYMVFCMAEDFDGNFSHVEVVNIKTEDVQVGPDPTMNLSLVPYNRGVSYDWTVKYEIDHDVEYFMYCYTQSASDLAAHISGLNQGHLNNIAGSGISYETWREGIYSWVAGGFENNGGGMRADSNTSQDWAGDQVTIAACIAVGQDEDGDPVYKLYHLICQGGKAQTLEEIFGIAE